jgi:hypothetical protein
MIYDYSETPSGAKSPQQIGRQKTADFKFISKTTNATQKKVIFNKKEEYISFG